MDLISRNIEQSETVHAQQKNMRINDTEASPTHKVLHNEIVGNILGHDIHIAYFFDNANKDVTLGNYDQSSVLRIEHGVGNIIKPLDALKIVNLFNLSREGYVDTAPTGRQEHKTHVLSSQVYDYDPKTHTIKILQYRLPEYHSGSDGHPYATWTGPHPTEMFHKHTNANPIPDDRSWSHQQEEETIVVATWTPHGVVIFPGLIGGNTFSQEVVHAKESLAMKRGEFLQKYVANAKKVLHEVQVAAMKQDNAKSKSAA